MKCPLITMSAITGNPSRDEIHSYMLSLKSNGIEQAMLYPRSGCEMEYLSERWFECIGDFISIAKELDMCIWLYDDFNWPSGDAGGRVTSVPEFRLQAISTRGESTGQISIKSRHNAGLFGEKFFPNLLSDKAIDYFIQCTHEEYFKRFANDFGTTIKGIFTDEPSIGYCCYNDYIPYYDGIKNDYFELYKRDFDVDMSSQYEFFYLNAITVISNRFRKCYLNKIASWCEAHGLLMTGHFMCDDNPIEGVRHNGNTLKNLRTLSLPGIDEISTCFDAVSEMSLLGIAEYASGKNGAMAELFALGPCDMSYAKKRAMLYLCACHKINHYFLAISHLDMRGNAIVKDFFNTFSADQPDFSAVKELSYEALCASTLAEKDFTPDVYIRFPFSPSAHHIAENVDTIPFLSVINTLTRNQIQWKYIDDEKVDAPVIELSDNLELTLDGKPFDLSAIQGTPIVTDMNGSLPEGIFVRRFDDGSFIALNLFSYEGEYLINGRKAFLGKYDIYISDDKEYSKNEKKAHPVFEISYKNDNIIRSMHLSSHGISEIDCKSDTEVIFAVRCDAVAYLNGQRLCCENDATLLPVGMSKLYKCSKKVLLKKGISTIKTDNDLKYLPSVLLIGNFESESISADTCKVILKERKSEYRSGEVIYGYGSVEFSANVEIPYGAESIEVRGTDLLTKVYINDTPIGQRAFSPYIFELEDNLYGQSITLKIVQASSIAPLFGDVDFWDKSIESCGWRGTPTPTNKPFGFSSLSFNLSLNRK